MLSLPSSSSSSSSSSSYSSRKKYDVFLSFRGEDTRKNFTDHLYAAFKKSGIETFRDDSKLEAGEEIAPELLKAIQESWCSVIVFSETYTFSGWCLDELAEIVEQRKQRGHKIFPIFYKVDPSDLRKQKGKVEEAFVKHGNKDKTQRWRTALTEVANLKGWHLNDRHESEFIEDIVTKILAKIWKTYPIVFDGLIGINPRLEKLYLKIDIGKGGVRIIGICGMGGIGKTTLARVVFNQMSRHFEGTSIRFEGTSFLADVREESKKRGFVSLQTQLLSQILLEKDFNLKEEYEGKDIIKNRLCSKKVLVVIDDADNKEHLDCLVGSRDWFGSGSRIIITTRDERLLKSYGVDDVYKPTTLDDNEALDLFNLKAFKSDTVPDNDLVELSKRVVDYADGLPLALEVLGSFLGGTDATLWRSAIESFESDSDKDILDKLQISFDGLKEKEKKIFLDIACFFIEEDKDFVINVLDGCEFFAGIGIDVLIKKSLIKVDESNKLRMHDLLQEMGRKIVQRKSPNEPGKRCRLWEEKDVDHVLMNNTELSLEAMDLSVVPSEVWESGEIIKVNLSRNSIQELPAELSSCLSLQTLILSRNNIKNWPVAILKSLPNLSCLKLDNNPLRQIPSDGFQAISMLQILDLSGNAASLPENPAFSSLPHLKELYLRRMQLREVPADIMSLHQLQILDLSQNSLQSISEGLKSLTSLTELDLSDNNISALPPELGLLEPKLQVLRLDGNPLRSIRRPILDRGTKAVLKYLKDKIPDQ